LGRGSSAWCASTEYEYQLDAYYAAVDYYIHFTSAPVFYCTDNNEFEIYKKLLSSPLPRYVILEGSANPLPLLGVYLKRQAPTFYHDAQLSHDVNLIRSVTTGFEEPAALSVFLGNVIDFKPMKKKSYAEGRGYIGYLLSAGNYHIKDNDLVKDNWLEAEWKVKGDKKLSNLKLQWSFRLGGKYHANIEIADVFYVALRRSRIDYDDHHFSWFKNSGLMYKFDFDTRTFKSIQHQLVADKKFPMPKGKIVPTLSLGFIWRAEEKYAGSLRTDSPNFEILFQPNIEF
jgi:hypothetical protein